MVTSPDHHLKQWCRLQGEDHRTFTKYLKACITLISISFSSKRKSQKAKAVIQSDRRLDSEATKIHTVLRIIESP